MFGLSTTLIAAIVVLVLVVVLLIILNARQKKAKAPAKRVDKPVETGSGQRAAGAEGLRGSTPAPSGQQAPPPYTPPVLREPAGIDPRFQEVESSGDTREAAEVSDATGDILSPPDMDPFAGFARPPFKRAITDPAETEGRVLEWDVEQGGQVEPARWSAQAEPGRPVAPARPGAGQAPPAGTVSLADPVARLVTSLLLGQGDLTEAELRRLELYRPGRVIMVADGMKEQLTGKGKEAQLSRLVLIQQNAETLRAQTEERVAVEHTAAPFMDEPEEPAAQAPSEISLDRKPFLVPPVAAATDVAWGASAVSEAEADSGTEAEAAPAEVVEAHAEAEPAEVVEEEPVS